MKTVEKATGEPKEMMENKLKEYMGKKSFCGVTGRGIVELCGCCGLITYKDELMEILLCDSFVKISGEKLTLKHYYGGRMVISGLVNCIEYCDMGGKRL